MSELNEGARRTLVTSTDIPTVEIFAVDKNDDIVASGIGKLTAELPLGIYQLRYRIGGKVVDKIISLRAGQGAMSVAPPELPIDTPALTSRGSQQTGRRWSSLVDEWSGSVDVTRGSGSHVFLFLNQTTTSEQVTEGAINALSLRTFEGVEITRLSAATRREEGCLGLGIELDPGTYLMRFEDPSKPAIEQTVVACKGWQTQVFFKPIKLNGAPTLDLLRWSILMRAIEHGYPADSEFFRWTEAARQSLANRRGAAAPVETMKSKLNEAEQIRRMPVDDATVDRMLREKLGNPMLGIFGAHLLLLNEKPDLALVREVATNLRSLIGDHPDVMSLLLYLGDAIAQSTAFPQPPMLRSSWDIVVQSKGPNLTGRVPSGSYSFKIGGRLWGSGAWLQWRAPEADSKAAATAQRPVDWNALLDAAVKIGAAGPERIRALLKDGQFTSAESAVLGCLLNAGIRTTLANTFASDADREKAWSYVAPVFRYFVSADVVKATEKATAASINPESIAEATAIPYSAVTGAAATLSQKLGLDNTSSSLSGVGGLARKLAFWS
jgi:hypothetical protein